LDFICCNNYDKKSEKKIAIAVFFCLKQEINGMVSPCQYRQKQKSYRNFPPAAFWPERAKE